MDKTQQRIEAVVLLITWCSAYTITAGIINGF